MLVKIGAVIAALRSPQKCPIAKRFKPFLAVSPFAAITHCPLGLWAIGLTLRSRQHFSRRTRRGWSIFLSRIIHSAAVSF